MKFRKKPMEVDAIRFDGRNYNECGLEWSTRVASWGIATLEGFMSATAGDWIITGVKNERYPCKPDVFEATYEKVE